MDAQPDPNNQPADTQMPRQRQVSPIEEEQEGSQSTFDSLTSEQKRGFLVFAIMFITLFCMLGLLSPDGRTFEKEFRNDVKNGTQVKDVVAYFKDRNLNWTWDKNNRQLTVILEGRRWIPFIKVDYKENVYFDNFNRLKGRSGSMEYKFFRQ